MPTKPTPLPVTLALSMLDELPADSDDPDVIVCRAALDEVWQVVVLGVEDFRSPMKTMLAYGLLNIAMDDTT